MPFQRPGVLSAQRVLAHDERAKLPRHPVVEFVAQCHRPYGDRRRQADVRRSALDLRASDLCGGADVELQREQATERLRRALFEVEHLRTSCRLKTCTCRRKLAASNFWSNFSSRSMFDSSVRRSADRLYWNRNRNCSEVSIRVLSVGFQCGQRGTRTLRSAPQIPGDASQACQAGHRVSRQLPVRPIQSASLHT